MVSVGVVGCGYWGPNLVRNFRNAPACLAGAVCDLDQKRLQHVKKLYPDVKTTTSFSDIVSDPDIHAVAVATPVRLHHEIGMAALDAGKHVFVEKPMASSAAQCRELVALAAEKNLTLMVGHTFLYSSPVRKIKEIVDSGDIGKLLYVSSRRLNLGLFQTDINVVWDLMPHDISIILYLMGQPPVSLNCQGSANINPRIEDVATLTMKFPNGGFASIHGSWLDPKKVRDMTIVGSRRMIYYDDIEPLQKIKIYDARVETPPHFDNFTEFQYAYHYGDMYAPRLDQQEPLAVQCRHFLDCIRSGDEPMTSGRRGLELVEILEAASESLGAGGASVGLERTALKAPRAGRG
ncbi:MAG: Gfo/Idh/MocA family oxidoreductase [Lentisphaerae bacterium]|nr:Gfo/Idh/MocA family oxidoreductase [Lentisphaerota bacterium]